MLRSLLFPCVLLGFCAGSARPALPYAALVAAQPATNGVGVPSPRRRRVPPCGRPGTARPGPPGNQLSTRATLGQSDRGEFPRVVHILQCPRREPSLVGVRRPIDRWGAVPTWHRHRHPAQVAEPGRRDFLEDRGARIGCGRGGVGAEQRILGAAGHRWPEQLGVGGRVVFCGTTAPRPVCAGASRVGSAAPSPRISASGTRTCAVTPATTTDDVNRTVMSCRAASRPTTNRPIWRDTDTSTSGGSASRRLIPAS